MKTNVKNIKILDPTWRLRAADDYDLLDLAVDVAGLLDVLQEHFYRHNKAKNKEKTFVLLEENKIDQTCTENWLFFLFLQP
jgi:hypothetical protein